MDILTTRRLNRATLARQMLLQREKTDVVAAVERLGGMQAQEARHPFTGLWSRVDGFRREDLHRALHDRLLVRATMMRATLHLMSAADYMAFRLTLGPALAAAVTGRTGLFDGLDLDRLLPVAHRLLLERPRDFTTLRGLLQKEFPEANERGLGYAVRTQLPLVMVPTEDRWAFPRTAAFTPADDWLGSELSSEPVERLVLRYLAAFGPATSADAQTWSGIKGLRAVLDGLRPRLRVFRDEQGRELFDLPDAPRPDEDVPAPARFLPDFDNLVLAHADRTRVIADEYREKVVTKNLRVRATFLWDGSVRGTWQVERRRKAAVLRLTPFESLSESAVSDLTREADALLRFAEPDAETLEIRIDDL
ncbi:winged helix DNA-binding domain-containing protein [Streptosporangium sp. NBC_01639]|uniref:winged helix DNA-binding domain-containing protein n=1 Tax=Streptosporangium sp. NBC_01639 TaxID=2975948 RepID=UPI00386A5196|nr:winged helix DNA-binding domain-containing protein [Streptosporangium sp. NBC_01639]